MSYEYSENVLVQDSAAALLHDELGWDVVYAYNQEVLGENGTLGRKNYKEIVLWRYFRQALKDSERNYQEDRKEDECVSVIEPVRVVEDLPCFVQIVTAR